MIGEARTILIIASGADDRSEIRRLLVSGSTRPYRFLEADSSTAGERPSDEVDCAILALDIPGPADFRRLEAMRDGGEQTSCPVVALVTDPAREVVAELLRAGVMDCLGKSWTNPDSLARTVDCAVERFALARERRLAGETLRAREERYRLLVDQTVDGIFLATRDGRYVDVNPSGCRMFGMTREEVLASSFSDVVDPAEHQRLPAAVSSYADGAVHRGEWRFLRKDGSGFIGELAGHELPNGWLQYVVRDITERKRMEDAMRASELRFQSMADAAPAMLWITEPDGSCSFLSSGWQEYTGQSREEALGYGWLQAIHPDDRERSERTFLAANRAREAFSLDHRLRRADGEDRWVIDSGRPRFDESGGFLGFIGAVIDVHDRKQVEEDLQAAHDTFRHLVQNSPFGVYVVDAEFRLVQVSAGAQKVFENVRPLLGRDFAEVLRLIWPEPFASESTELFRQTLATGEPYHAPSTVERRQDIGELESYDWKIERVMLPDGRFGVVCHFYDLSERQRYEAALQESEERFRTLADNMSQLAWMTDERGWVFWYNKRWYDYTGTTLQEMQGWGWKQVHHPDHVARVVEHIQYSWDTGEPWEDTFPMRGRDGQYRWFLSRALPIRDEQGRVVRWFGTNTDITEQRNLEESLRDQDRRKDEFLAMLAHELRNPLAPIRNATQILRLTGPKEPVLDASRDIIERQVNHLVRLVDDLLEVSRVSRGKIKLQKAPLDLVAVVRHAVETSRPLIDGRRHALSLTVPPGPVRVDGDFTRLTQVISNLLNNAAKYTDEGGTIHLSVDREGASRGRTGEAVVRVRDNGRGIEPQALSSLFDLFYQADRNLDRSDGGLGIGLSLVKSLVDMHGGRVRAFSGGRGTGSEFVIRIPLLPEPESAPGEGPTTSPARAAQGVRVLVVDDNEDSAESMSRLLRFDGHEVLTAHDGRKAVEVALRERPAVVLMDLGLPYLDGYQACRAIREGGLKEALIVAMTGYGQDEDRVRSQQAAFDAHLVKPVDFMAVRSLLSNRRRSD